MTNCCSHKYLTFFKAVHDNHRQKILDIIKKHREINASEINKKVKLSQPTISHHLSILSEAGVIKSVKKGKEMFYSINKKKITSCCMDFLKIFS